jgi:cation diffusion facilitator CzcD-associated flavoprotein CzcO
MGEAEGRFDPEAVRARYRAERDKRLVDGRADIRDLATDEHFAAYRRDPFTPFAARAPIDEELEVLIVGAGIAGLTTAARLAERQVEGVRLVDEAGGVGGTWYWNRYPGAMCDVESYLYLPLLEEMGTIPTTRYASGAEILAHLEAIAQRYDLESSGLFHTRVTEAAWDEDRRRWRITTDRGDVLRPRYYVLCVGILNLLKLPAIEGMEDFEGPSFHSARWDYSITGGGPEAPMDRLADKVVGLVGTGASGIQILAPLAAAAKEVVVFQRTPSAIGVRGNRPTPPGFAESLAPGWQRDRNDNFQAIMLGRRVEEDLVDDGWTHHYALVQHPPRVEGMSLEEYLANGERVDFEVMEEHRRRIDAKVADAEVAEQLKPWYRYLCKRPCFHDEYFEAFNRDNVTLVSCPAGFDRIGPHGPVVDGRDYPCDVLVYATGFEAELTPLHRRAGHPIRGVDGLLLSEKWAEGASSLYGIMSRSFPNLFVLPAPGQQAVVTVNYTQLAEAGATFVASAIDQLRRAGITRAEVSEAAEADWCEKIVASFVDGSRLMGACTPSRLNFEGHPELANPRNANFGRGFGDWFAYRDLLEGWVADGGFPGLEVDAGDAADAAR